MKITRNRQLIKYIITLHYCEHVLAKPTDAIQHFTA